QRIVDLVVDLAEVTIAHLQRRNRRADDVAVVVDGPLIVAEEEHLAPDDRAAQGESAVDELRWRLQVRKVVAGVRLVVVAEEKRASLQVIGAGLEGHVSDRAARSS